MGLCKCRKRTITNQFCFEHSVNVCEHCIVPDHPKCIVQSYRQWLEDSDYSPVCQLCQEDLVSAECIRLVCYDIFHEACLDEWASKHPSNTAPAGYKCPVCSLCIFPAPNLVSPVADNLKEIFRKYDWAREGLGLPVINKNSLESQKTDTSSSVVGTHNNLHGDRGIPDGLDTSVGVSTPGEEFHNSLGSSQLKTSSTSSSKIRFPEPSSSVYINSEEDTGDNKYKRRPALEWFNRWLRTFQKPSSRHHQGFFGGKKRMSLLLTILTVCTIIVLLSYLGRNSSNDDPMLDPFNNPNIRVEEEKM